MEPGASNNPPDPYQNLLFVASWWRGLTALLSQSPKQDAILHITSASHSSLLALQNANECWLTSSRPDAILVDSIKRAPRTSFHRKEERAWGNRKHFESQRQPQPLHLLPRYVTLASSFQDEHIHLVEVKYREDTRPKNRLEALSTSIITSVAISQGVQLKSPSIMLSVGGVVYTPRTLGPLKAPWP
eukprot:1152113-Pelagomonas_calceolata.AAC.3